MLSFREMRRSIAAILLVLYLPSCSTHSNTRDALTPKMAPDSATLAQLQKKVEGRDRVGVVVGIVRAEVRHPTLDGTGIRLGPDANASTVPWSDVSRIDVRSSAIPRGLLIGAVTGLAVGGLAGLAAGVAATGECGGGYIEICGASAWAVPGLTAIGAVGGALAFGFIGMLVAAPFGRWSTVYRGRPQPTVPAIALRPIPGGIAVAATVAF